MSPGCYERMDKYQVGAQKRLLGEGGAWNKTLWVKSKDERRASTGGMYSVSKAKENMVHLGLSIEFQSGWNLKFEKNMSWDELRKLIKDASDV